MKFFFSMHQLKLQSIVIDERHVDFFRGTALLDVLVYVTPVPGQLNSCHIEKSILYCRN